MKIILLQDIAKIGKKFDVANVSDGYALNYLIPRNLAEPATSAKEKEIEKKRAEEKAKREAYIESVSKEINDLKGKSVILEVKANERGKLFASIEKKHLVSALKEQFNLDLDKESIILEDPIKELGEYSIPIDLDGKDLSLSFSIKLKEEKE